MAALARWYVELLSDARTPLADFFNSLRDYRAVDILLNHRLQSLWFVVGSCQFETSVQQSPIQMF